MNHVYMTNRLRKKNTGTNRAILKLEVVDLLLSFFNIATTRGR